MHISIKIRLSSSLIENNLLISFSVSKWGNFFDTFGVEIEESTFLLIILFLNPDSTCEIIGIPGSTGIDVNILPIPYAERIPLAKQFVNEIPLFVSWFKNGVIFGCAATTGFGIVNRDVKTSNTQENVIKA